MIKIQHFTTLIFDALGVKTSGAFLDPSALVHYCKYIIMY